MCGIVGYLGKEVLVDGLLTAFLKKMEYRGYDSAGIAFVQDGSIRHVKSIGTVEKLVESCQNNMDQASDYLSQCAIGHIRWATHGSLTLNNTHPHITQNCALVHNGIIENYKELRHFLMQQDVSFHSETDSEVVVALFQYHLNNNNQSDYMKVLRLTLEQLKGSYAFVILTDDNHMLFAVQNMSMIVGYADDSIFISSDIASISDHADRFSYLECGDYGFVSLKDTGKCHFWDKSHNVVVRESRTIELDFFDTSKAGFEFFMHKEIYEQPTCIKQIISKYYDHATKKIDFPDLNLPLSSFDNITILACGTSYYAGIHAQYVIESLLGIRVTVEIASEFQYRSPVIDQRTLFIAISQSGETADTLAVIKMIANRSKSTLAFVNMPYSGLTKIASNTIHIYAGNEVGVASTKAFTNQLVATLLFMLYLNQESQHIDSNICEQYMLDLLSLPKYIDQVLDSENTIKQVSVWLSQFSSAFYIGRGLSYVVALEGALKLKEISYIHAEAYPAGELKHGPLALIDQNNPVIVIMPDDQWYDKTLSNVHEILARDGKIILITSKHNEDLMSQCEHVLHIPNCHALLSPILSIIVVQLMAYHVAHHKKLDLDKPRNLSKTVTVE